MKQSTNFVTALAASSLAFAIAFLGVLPVQAAEGWKARWDKVLAAAKKEGKLVVSGPSGRTWRGQLEAFAKDYPDIKIEVTPFSSREFWPRVVKEREVGKHLWDLRVGGSASWAWKLKDTGGIAPVRPMLILPEVTKEANWHGGFKQMYLDTDKKFFPSFCVYESVFAFVNRDVIKTSELKTMDDLLNPKWAGKVSMASPRGGSTAVSMGVLYKAKGPQYIKDFFAKVKPVITKNRRQLMGWFQSGKYPISIGIPNSSIIRFRKRGVKLNMGKVKGIDMWSSGVCTAQVLEPRPHPNATIVFVNWLLSKKTMARITKATRLNARFKGIPVRDKNRAVDMKNLQQYISGQTEDFKPYLSKAKKLVRKITR